MIQSWKILMPNQYKIIISDSLFATCTHQYGGIYRYYWMAWLVAWYYVSFVNDCAEAAILKKII